MAKRIEYLKHTFSEWEIGDVEHIKELCKLAHDPDFKKINVEHDYDFYDRSCEGISIEVIFERDETAQEKSKRLEKNRKARERKKINQEKKELEDRIKRKNLYEELRKEFGK